MYQESISDTKKAQTSQDTNNIPMDTCWLWMIILKQMPAIENKALQKLILLLDWMRYLPIANF